MKARENPFSADRIDNIRYRPLGTTFDELLGRLQQMNYRAAIIGPEGSGKTTLLENLRISLAEKGLATRSIFANDTNPFTRSKRTRFLFELKGEDIVFLDGADSLGRFAWLGLKRGILKRDAGLVITTHKSGLLPTLIECETAPELFRDIVAELLLSKDGVGADFFNGIYHRHNGNIRTSLRELYDIYANDENLDTDKLRVYHSTPSQTE